MLCISCPPLLRVLTRKACFFVSERSRLMWTTLPWAMCQKRTRGRKKRELKEVLIHSCRCVTLLLPHQKFTTELMTKGQAPCSPLWPGEQYGGCEWLIPLDRWQVGPLSNLGLISPLGWAALWQGWENPDYLQPLSLRPEQRLGAIVKEKYYLHCQVVAVFVMSEDELGENMPPEGDYRATIAPTQTVNAI